ncbi:MAG: 50S ribosomal protein L29 [Planctomycetes bacterium]|nr:50S ribosomal protein L29 [Planctomycetota bacterium]
MTAEEMRERADEDLRREVAALQKEIWNLRFRRGSEKAGDPSKLRAMRRQVARMMTVLRERRLGIVRKTAKA